MLDGIRPVAVWAGIDCNFCVMLINWLEVLEVAEGSAMNYPHSILLNQTAYSYVISDLSWLNPQTSMMVWHDGFCYIRL